MLFNEPKLLKFVTTDSTPAPDAAVSVLFNEPKLLKSRRATPCGAARGGFSALQRAEIAEILPTVTSAGSLVRFSALQRAEIAEIDTPARPPSQLRSVSVLFNEPKLLKSRASV